MWDNVRRFPANYGWTEIRNGGDTTANIYGYIRVSTREQNERINIRQRQAEGIAAAKARGVRFGRPPGPLPENYHNAYQRWKAGAITGTAAAKECGMPLSTVRYRAVLYEKAGLL